MSDDLRAAVEEALSLSHEILPQTIDDVIAIVREHDAPVIEEPPHRSSGWSMEVGVLKRALRYVPDSYEVMLTNAEVDDCEIADLHIERMYPPDAEGPGLLVLVQGQVVTSEYGYRERMDEDHELGTSMHWNDRKGRWQSR